MGRIAIVLIVVGAIGFAWYIGFGVKGCDEYGGNPMCDRMDRDYAIGMWGLGAIGVGLLLGLVAGLRKLGPVQSQ